jgi:hypothetical protein
MSSRSIPVRSRTAIHSVKSEEPIDENSAAVLKPMVELSRVFAAIVAAHVPAMIRGGTPLTEDLVMRMFMENFPSLSLANETRKRGVSAPRKTVASGTQSKYISMCTLIDGPNDRFTGENATNRLWYPNTPHSCFHRSCLKSSEGKPCEKKVEPAQFFATMHSETDSLPAENGVFCSTHAKQSGVRKRYYHLIKCFNNINELYEACLKHLNLSDGDNGVTFGDSEPEGDGIDSVMYPNPKTGPFTMFTSPQLYGVIINDQTDMVIGVCDAATGNITPLNDEQHQYLISVNATKFYEGPATNISQLNPDDTMNESNVAMPQPAVEPRAAAAHDITSVPKISRAPSISRSRKVISRPAADTESSSTVRRAPAPVRRAPTQASAPVRRAPTQASVPVRRAPTQASAPVRRAPAPVQQAQIPVQQAPAQIPVQQAPVQIPVQQAPAQIPVQQAPVQIPVQQIPVQQAPAQIPVQQIPVQQAPAQIPVQQAPAQIPVQQAPAQIPVQQAQVQIPVQQAPAQIPVQQAAAQIPAQIPVQQAPVQIAAQ